MQYLRAGRILKVNLTEGRITTEPVDAHADRFVGGKGINAKLLFDSLTPAAGPFDPGNPLLFGAGPLVGTPCPGACRTDVMSRSPVTGAIGNSDIGGHLGPELKFAGYDHLVIEGRADRPVYLSVQDDAVQIHDASSVWGSDTYETQRKIREALKDPEMKVACIGPAGEHIVHYATIRSGTGNSASRTGMGAVMGSKRLKAIAVRGTRGLTVADPGEFLSLCRRLFGQIRQSKVYQDLHEAGITRLHDKEMRNTYWLMGTEWEDGHKICEATFLERNLTRRAGCFSCPVACFDSYNIEGVGSGTVKCSPYGDLTWDIRNTDMKVFWRAFVKCQRYGLDARSLSNALAWLMELHEHGIVTSRDTDGMAVQWGSPEAIVALARKMSFREGIGDLLADGLPAAARKIGRGAEQYLLLAKGSPSSMHGFPAKVLGLSSAVSPTGEDAQIQPRLGFLPAWIYAHTERDGSFEQVIEKYKTLAEKEVGVRMAAEPRSTEGKAALVRQAEQRTDVYDLAGVCTWVGPFMGLPVDEGAVAQLLSLGSGAPVTPDMLREAGMKMRHVHRALEAQLGMGRDDDRVSGHYYFGRSQPGGRPMQELAFTREELETMKDDYYRLMEWDPATGLPTPETLGKYGLGDVAKRLTV